MSIRKIFIETEEGSGAERGSGVRKRKKEGKEKPSEALSSTDVPEVPMRRIYMEEDESDIVDTPSVQQTRNKNKRAKRKKAKKIAKALSSLEKAMMTAGINFAEETQEVDKAKRLSLYCDKVTAAIPNMSTDVSEALVEATRRCAETYALFNFIFFCFFIIASCMFNTTDLLFSIKHSKNKLQ